MDGLLIDSEPFWRQSHIEILGKYGFVITQEDVRQAAGKRTRDQVELWHERFGWEEPSIDDVTQAIVDNVIDLIHINGEALPGVYELIELMRSHEIPLGVASSSALDLIEVVLKKLALAEQMDVVVSAEDEARGKPFPDVFLTAATKLNVQPDQCIVFEDSLNGIKAAKAAGMKCVAVPEEHHKDNESFKEADLVVSSLKSLRWKDITELWN